MGFFRSLYNLLLEALFPISAAEGELFSYTPQQAFDTLPKAPIVPSIADVNAIAVFAYKDERVSRLVWNIKYKKSVQAVAMAGYALRRVLNLMFYSNESLSTAPAIIVVPMPITKRRRRERGYNQCELITNEMASHSGDSVPIFFENNLLLRVQHTSHQKFKDREERLRLAEGLFKVDEKVLTTLRQKIVEKIPTTKLEDIHLIVIDDVITTGSTMKKAVEALSSAVFKNITCMAVAH